MAANAENITQVSSMPIPPMHYVKLYTDDAVKRGSAPKPPPPIQETYSMFGVTINNDDAIIQSLESQGIKRLYSAKDIDRKKELRKLNHSILVNFLDLIDILIKCPESPKRDEKIEDTNLLFIHMHHLINEFRPHQARETLRVMLMVQRRKRTQFTGKFKEHLEKVEGIIQEAIDNLPDTEVENGMDTSDIKDFKDKGAKSNEDGEKENCNSLDRIMCQIVDELSLDMD
jgi:mediator of RNA polymerase II transcription subunit 7